VERPRGPTLQAMLPNVLARIAPRTRPKARGIRGADELANHKRRCPDRVSAGQGICLVGVAGFEPTASSSRTKRAAKLRHTPRCAMPY
jgi:hypothetical protein